MTPPLIPLLAVLALLRGAAIAHGGLANYTVGPTWYRGYDPNEPSSEQLNQPWLTQRSYSTIDPLFSPSSPYMPCNDPAIPPVSSIPISAGEILTAIYWYWLHPVGPMSVWLAPCPEDNCSTANLTSVSWYKIWEAGLLEGPNLAEGMWEQKRFQRWDGEPAEWKVRIPKGLRGGRWIVRHEILSIHVAGKPQFYVQCAHLDVGGREGKGVKGEGDMPPERFAKRFPGAYEGDEASIFIDIYAPELSTTTNYTIPGGPIWEGFADAVVKDEEQPV